MQCIAIGSEAVEHLVRRGLAEQPGEVLAEQFRRARRGRVEGKAAVADDQRGDTLDRLLHALRLSQADQVIMAVRVDEARREIPSGSVECLGISFAPERRTNLCYLPVTADPDVTGEPRRAG